MRFHRSRLGKQCQIAWDALGRLVPSPCLAVFSRLSGIKKEVSVGCAMGEAACSICGADVRKKGCRHEKGKWYGGKLCHTVLDCPTDAYEWSFVAVPAQREAGVVKCYRPQSKKEDDPMEEWISQLQQGKACHLSEDQSRELYRAWR